MRGSRYHSTVLHVVHSRVCSRVLRLPEGIRPCTGLGRRRTGLATRAASPKAPSGNNIPKVPLQPPLSERPAVHEVPASQLAAWRSEALTAAKNSAAALTGPDDPCFADLQRELQWLLEDAVEGHQIILHDHSNVMPAKLRLPWREMQSMWQRRLKNREPLQYLTNAAHWRDLVLAVGPGTLIPRPETEQVIDFALEAAREDDSLGSGVWADLGTGSGALALGLAKALPGISQVLAVDLSPDACAWAGFNVERLGLSDRVQIMNGSWFEPLEGSEGQVTGILSNPPYIERETLPGLQAEVGLHEPESALDGGPGEGLDCLEIICSQADRYLRPGGFLALETGGPHQTQAVSRILASSFTHIQQRLDCFGVKRFVTAIRI